MKDDKPTLYWAAVKTSLMMFMVQAFTSLNPGHQLVDNWHLRAILEALEDCISGAMPRLIINLPPRHLKSFITSVVLPAFILGLDPTAKIIVVSYSEELAKALSADFRRILESQWYRLLFSATVISKFTEGEVTTTLGGGRYATSVGGSLTGRGADFIIIDDPIKPVDAESPARRTAVNDFYSSTLYSRLNDKERGVIILVMQRVHINDLTSVVEYGHGFHKLSFPAIATRDEIVTFRDGQIHTRKCGTALHEEWESLESLEKTRQVLKPSIFAAQYQQSPLMPEGDFFKHKWFRMVKETPNFQKHGDLYLTVDTAISVSETADFTALALVHYDGKNFSVLYADRGHWEYETIRDRLIRSREKFPNLVFVIENTGVGIPLILSLRKLRLPTWSYQPKDSKMIRASKVVPIFADGRVYILNCEGSNEWVEPFTTEFLSFPFGANDDWVDSISQLLFWADMRGGVHGYNNGY